VDKTKTPKKLEKNWKRRKPLKKIYLPFIVFIVAVSPLLLLAVSLFAPFIVFIVAVSPLLLLAVLLFGPTVHHFYCGCLAITSTGYPPYFDRHTERCLLAVHRSATEVDMDAWMLECLYML
jgi:hypothetical protein